MFFMEINGINHYIIIINEFYMHFRFFKIIKKIGQKKFWLKNIQKNDKNKKAKKTTNNKITIFDNLWAKF